jgi:hypothetical protein
MPTTPVFHTRKQASSSLNFNKYAPVVAVTVLVTLAASNFLKPQPVPEQHGPRDFLPSTHGRALQQMDDAGSRQSPRWQLPEEWKRKVGCASSSTSPQ